MLNSLMIHQLEQLTMRQLVLGPRALAPSNMRETSRDSLPESACKENICEVAQPICCTKFESKKCENDLTETNKLKSYDNLTHRAMFTSTLDSKLAICFKLSRR